MRILFANVGWMKRYKGQSEDDRISDGGSYDPKDKHEVLRLEVKGQGDHATYVCITRNEYDKMRNAWPGYRLCVVMDALGRKCLHTFATSDGVKWVCEEKPGLTLHIDQNVAAQATFEWG